MTAGQYVPGLSSNPVLVEGFGLSALRNESLPSVLAIVSFFPYPATHGDALRRGMLLESLNKTSRLTVLSVRRPETDDEALHLAGERLRGSSVEVFEPTIGAAKSLFARMRRIAHGLLGLAPPSIYSQWSRDLNSRVSQISSGFDAVVLVGEGSGIYKVPKGAKRVIWDKSNVMVASCIDEARNLASFGARLRASVTLPWAYLFERRTLRRVDEVWVTSNEEGVRLHKWYGDQPTRILPSAARTGSVAVVSVNGTGDYVWMSTLGYAPNWDGLVRMLSAFENDLPRDFRLRVIGAGATAEQERFLRRYKFVSYLGYQEDLAAACDGARAATVPIWAGAGVKLKTVTLMQMGLPLLATPVALEGIPNSIAAGVARVPEDFVSIVRELTQSDLSSARRNGLEFIRTELSQEKFDGLVSEYIRSLDAGHARSGAGSR